MDYTGIRKRALRVFIGFLALTALVAAISVVSGEFGDIQLKVLATTLTISAASICSMACAAYIEKRKRTRQGLVGIALSVLGALLVIVGLWPPIDSDEYWKTAITVVIWAVACAHGLLMLLPDLDGRQKIVQSLTVVSIAILSALIMVAVWTEMENEGYYRIMALAAIAVALETLVIPILLKLKTGAEPEASTLVLERVAGQTYRDASGELFEVRRVESSSQATTE